MLLKHIAFLQGDDAIIPLDMLNDDGEASAIEYLEQWNYGEGERYNCPYWGKNDTVYTQDDLILTYNILFGYIGLCRRLG